MTDPVTAALAAPLPTAAEILAGSAQAGVPRPSFLTDDDDDGTVHRVAPAGTGSFVVQRAMQDGATEYLPGDTREMRTADAAELVAIGALTPVGVDPPAREPAVRHTFGSVASEVNARGFTSASGDAVVLTRPSDAAHDAALKRLHDEYGYRIDMLRIDHAKALAEASDAARAATEKAAAAEQRVATLEAELKDANGEGDDLVKQVEKLTAELAALKAGQTPTAGDLLPTDTGATAPAKAKK